MYYNHSLNIQINETYWFSLKMSYLQILLKQRENKLHFNKTNMDKIY